MAAISELARPRRVVTGVGADGMSRVARVEDVERVDHPYVLPTTTGASAGGLVAQDGPGGLFRVWASDRIPVPLPSDGSSPALDFDVDPDETPAVLRRASTFPPPLGIRIGVGVAPRAGSPGRMHWTDSTDVIFVMAGRQGQILDDGDAVLGPGDVLIQNGTMHSHQTLEAPVVLGLVTLGALRTAPPPSLKALHLASGTAEPYRGGFRPGETREKRVLGSWDAPAPEPRDFDVPPRPGRIEEMLVPRRLITGTDERGRSYFACVEDADEVVREGALTVWRIWGAERLPVLVPHDTATSAAGALSLDPGPLGVVVSMARIAPAQAPTEMRRRDSMDSIFVMAGLLTCILDGGERIELRPGDVLIQNGARHAWHNTGRTAAVVGAVAVGAARLDSSPSGADA